MTDDLEYERVTEVLYPYSGLHHIDKQVLEKAATRGTKVHKICEGIVKGLGNWSKEDPEVAGYIHSFMQWYNDSIEIIELERRFYCDDYLISGQVDMIANINGILTIIDIKTPQKPSKTWMLQGSAYCYLARKAGCDIKSMQFLQLNKHGMKPRIYEYKEDFELFKKCLDIYNYFYKPKDKDDKSKGIKKPKYAEVSKVTKLPTDA